MYRVSSDNERPKVTIVLILILLVSNIFSGLVSVVLISVGLLTGMVNNYISTLNLLVGLVISLTVFLSSVKTWKQEKKYFQIFLGSWLAFYFYYLYNRFLDSIYLLVPKTELLGKCLFMTFWIIFLVYYFRKSIPMGKKTD